MNILRMKYLYTIVTIALLFKVSTGIAQNIPSYNYQPLKCAGHIPADFISTPYENYKTATQLDPDSDQQLSKEEKNFYTTSNFLMDQLLHSGLVLFGDSVINYLNAITNEILDSNPELSRDVRVYTLLSNEANAFTAENGIILVTTGLVAQAQNEAQLAFVLCHELSHYYLKHAIENLEETIDQDKRQGDYAGMDKDEIDLANFRYSKERELESDKKGLEYYLNTKYSISAIDGLFDVLLYSYLPFNEVEFPATYFNDSIYTIPTTWFLDSLNEVTATEDYDDSESTHPNIKTRKAEIVKQLKSKKTDDKLLYVVDKTLFNNIQRICRYEGCGLFLEATAFTDALYQAFLIEHDYGANTFTREIIAKSLYGESVYDNYNVTPEGYRNYRKIEGESHKIHHFIHTISDKDLNILALKSVWSAYQLDTSKNELYKMAKQLTYQLGTLNDISKNDFYTSNKYKTYLSSLKKDSIGSAEFVEMVVKKEEPVSKYEKLKTKSNNNEEKISDDAPYWKFAFINELNDRKFLTLFSADNPLDSALAATYDDVERDRIFLGQKKVIMLDPFHLNVNETMAVRFNLADQDYLINSLKDRINKGATENKLDIIHFSFYELDSTEIDKFNDISIIKRWSDERFKHLEYGVSIVTTTANEMEALSEKYEVDHFIDMGLISITLPEENMGVKIFTGIVFFPYLPFVIADAITPNRYTYYYAYTGNLKTDELFFLQSEEDKSSPYNSKQLYRVDELMEMIHIDND
jgi:hypothetical protein